MIDVSKIRAEMELWMQKHQVEQKAKSDQKRSATLECEEGDLVVSSHEYSGIGSGPKLIAQISRSFLVF